MPLITFDLQISPLVIVFLMDHNLPSFGPLTSESEVSCSPQHANEICSGLSQDELEALRAIVNNWEAFQNLPTITDEDGKFDDRYKATQARLFGGFCVLLFDELKISGRDRMISTLALIEQARQAGRDDLVFPQPVYATDHCYVSRYIERGRPLTRKEAQQLMKDLDGLWQTARNEIRRGISLDPMIERNAFVGTDGKFVVTDPVVEAQLAFGLRQLRRAS